jgi:hypothetical protein
MWPSTPYIILDPHWFHTSSASLCCSVRYQVDIFWEIVVIVLLKYSFAIYIESKVTTPGLFRNWLFSDGLHPTTYDVSSR